MNSSTQSLGNALRSVGWNLGALVMLPFLGAALLVSCSPKAPAPQAPSSSLTRSQARQMAEFATLSAKDASLFEVTSRSMVPALDEKSFVILLPCAYADLRAGDLVVYHNARGDIVHRLLSVGPQGWEVKGDANSSTDPDRVTKANLIGRAAAIIYSR